MIRRRIRFIVLGSAALLLVTTAPRAQYDYGGGSGSYSDGGATGFVLLLEAQLANPRNVDNVVGTEIVGSRVTSLIPVWDDEFAGRAGLGWQWSSGKKIMLTGWALDTEQELARGGNIAFAIGPPIATGVGDGFIGDTGNSLDVTTELTAFTGDLAWSIEHELAEDVTLEWTLGLRYASYEEEHAAQYTDPTFDFAAAKRLEGEAIGGRAALRGRYRFAGPFSAAGGFGFTALDATIKGTSSLTPTPSSFASSSASIEDDSRSGAIRDFDVEVTWHSAADSVRVALGWEQSQWSGFVADPLRNFPGTVVALSDRDEVVFSAYRLGLRFIF